MSAVASEWRPLLVAAYFSHGRYVGCQWGLGYIDPGPGRYFADPPNPKTGVERYLGQAPCVCVCVCVCLSVFECV